MVNKFYRKVLKNGMTIIFEKRDLPLVSVAYAVRSGGINEALSEKGISHFIEHLLYKGTPKRNAQQISDAIEKNGGILNGFTDETLTAFWCKMPSSKLNLALDVLTDMIKNPLFDLNEFEKERQVIFEEIKMRKDSPQIYVYDKIQSFLYSGTLGNNLIGTYSTMNSITREKLIKKFRETYTPNNLILCVVGNANFNRLVKFVEKNFDNSYGKIPSFKIDTKNKNSEEKRKGVDQMNLVLAYHVPLSDNKKSYAALVLNSLLAGGMSSRLFKEIREKRNLAYAVKGDSNINKKYAYNAIYVGAKKENKRMIIKLILEEFKKVSLELTEEELNTIKTKIIGNYQISQEESVTQMMNLLSEEINGNAKSFYVFEDEIRKVKLEDVKLLAKNLKYSLFVLMPEE